MREASVLSQYAERVAGARSMQRRGHVTHVLGLVIESQGPAVSVGELCTVSGEGGRRLTAEVVGFRDQKVLLMPLGDMKGVHPGSEVRAVGHPMLVPAGRELLGRVLDGLGGPIDGRGPVQAEAQCPIERAPINPLDRRRIASPLGTGVRAIDAVLTCGRGQRVGIFSGSGVGKSVLLGMIAQQTEADVNVIGLIGERGREVREFLEKDLRQDGLERSVVVVATSDQPALVRIKAAQTLVAIAEHFRDRGLDVMLMMDSITRYAMALREVGLAVGEPPTTKGYTPSVFATLPKLLERAGTCRAGSITGLYTVLVEADDMNEPVADAVRAILDGHIVLSRELALRNHYPAIDVLQSLSRVMIDIVPREHLEAARRLQHHVAVHSRAQDLINIGAYKRGSNPEIDRAIAMMPKIEAFLRQDIAERSEYRAAVHGLIELVAKEAAVEPAGGTGGRA
jgi:flagellum-specific ATP synthase